MLKKFPLLSRRTLLRSAGGVALALPLLESAAWAGAPAAPKRMVCIGSTLGFVPGEFFPEQLGHDYALPRLLQPLAHLRDQFTVMSGLDHGVNAQGGHNGCHALLSGVLGSNARNYPDSNITVDQRAAAHVGAATRYPSLVLSPQTDNLMKMSWTGAGTSITPIESLQQTFDLLFMQDNPAKIDLARRRLTKSQSILDMVTDQAKALGQQVGAADRQRVDQYLTSVRELELRLSQSGEWLDVAKPAADYALPAGADQASYKERLRLWYDLMALALQTDSTRVITLELSGIREASSGFNLSRGYHALSHHGKIPEVLEELHVIEAFHMAEFARFLDRLKSVQEPGGETLFDATMSLIGSGLGNAASHSNKNLPLLLAGGGFRHAGHLAIPEKRRDTEDALATNLYLTMLQRFGLEIDSFNTSAHTLTGLELA